MHIPQVGAATAQPTYKNCLESTKAQITFLCVGGILITLGLLLIGFSQNAVMSSLGGICTSIGVPFVVYGLFMMIYNRCVKRQQKPEEQTIKPIKTPTPQPKPKPSKPLSEAQREKQRELAAKAALKRQSQNI